MPPDREIAEFYVDWHHGEELGYLALNKGEAYAANVRESSIQCALIELRRRNKFISPVTAMKAALEHFGREEK
jgi:hypothetical protein